MLRYRLGIQDKDPDECVMDDVVGVERQVMSKTETAASIIVHQRGYVSKIVEDFEQRFNNGQPLQQISTPCKETVDKHDLELMELPGVLADVASELHGKLLWPVRGSRPDCAVAVSRISRRLNAWSGYCDYLVWRLFRCLKTTLGLGVQFDCNLLEFAKWFVATFADADHANDRWAITKSTSGRLTFVMGDHTRMVITWGCKLQDATAKSTPEAELILASDATTKTTIPLVDVLETLTGRSWRAVTLADNETCQAVVESGFSRKMAYVRKYQDVSVGLPHDWHAREENRTEHVESAEQVADIMTKPLDHTSHWRLVRSMNMKAVAVTEPAKEPDEEKQPTRRLRVD